MTSAITVNTRGNARICVPYALDQITTFVLLEQEDWFEDEIHFVRRCLLPGMSVVDVGANFGVYTTAMAQTPSTSASPLETSRRAVAPSSAGSRMYISTGSRR